jgi:hypothetical protein
MYLHENMLSLENNPLKFKTSRKQIILPKESMEFGLNLLRKPKDHNM